MADEADKTPEPDENDDELLLDEPLEPDEGEEVDETEDEGDEEEDVLTFGDEITEEKPDDSSLIKHLRAQIRDRDKRLAETGRARSEPIEVGPKPTLADTDYDEEKYEEQLDAWKERKAAAEAQQGRSQQAQQAEQEEWKAELERYNAGKTKLGFEDVDDAEETIKATLDTIQQAVLVKATDDPARVMYALAKHPDRLTSIASIRDPLKLASALAKLEGQLKVVKKRKAPPPDEPERGSAKVSKSNDRTLAKLEKKAEETGERSELIAYKKRLKERAAKS